MTLESARGYFFFVFSLFLSFSPRYFAPRCAKFRGSALATIVIRYAVPSCAGIFCVSRFSTVSAVYRFSVMQTVVHGNCVARDVSDNDKSGATTNRTRSSIRLASQKWLAQRGATWANRARIGDSASITITTFASSRGTRDLSLRVMSTAGCTPANNRPSHGQHRERLVPRSLWSAHGTRAHSRVEHAGGMISIIQMSVRIEPGDHKRNPHCSGSPTLLRWTSGVYQRWTRVCIRARALAPATPHARSRTVHPRWTRRWTCRRFNLADLLAMDWEARSRRAQFLPRKGIALSLSLSHRGACAVYFNPGTDER